VIANGAPEGVNWREAVTFAIAEATRLKEGSVKLVDGMYGIEGMAASNSEFDAIKSAVSAALPAGLQLDSENVRRPIISPYTWTFTNMENAAPSLAGYIPEEDLATDTIERIETSLGTAMPVTNALEIGAGAPENLNAAISVAVSAASRLFNAKAEISDTNVTITGEALTERAAEQVRAAIENGLPPGFTGSHDIALRQVTDFPVIQADECQALLTRGLESNSIRFESGKSAIRSVSFGLLDRLAFIVKRCPTAIVEIEGHTDSDGADDDNLALSQERANTVRSYLVRNGVFASRLKATGYGESDPVADNATDDVKALNRRIEFTVIR